MVYLRKFNRGPGVWTYPNKFHFFRLSMRSSWFLVWKPNPERKTINQMWKMFTEDREKIA